MRYPMFRSCVRRPEEYLPLKMSFSGYFSLCLLTTLTFLMFATADNTTSSLEGTSKIQGRVAGGTKTQYGQMPWTVSVRIRDKHVCSGVLVYGARNTHIVLTLATCLLVPKPATRPYSYKVVSVIAGRVNINSPSDYQQERKAKWLWGNWEKVDWVTHDWDISLIVLESNFDVNSKVAPISLPMPGQSDPEDGFVTVSGWGYEEQDSKDEKIIDRMEAARMPIQEWKHCYDKYRLYFSEKNIMSKELSACAGSKSEGACSGDEGSPAAGITPQGQPYLWGIFQWTHGECPDKLLPGIYANIANYMEYIDEWCAAEIPSYD